MHRVLASLAVRGATEQLTPLPSVHTHHGPHRGAPAGGGAECNLEINPRFEGVADKFEYAAQAEAQRECRRISKPRCVRVRPLQGISVVSTRAEAARNPAHILARHAAR